MPKSIANMYKMGGYTAIAGGAMNILSSYIPFTKNSIILESFYLVIDLGLLFGLLAIYMFFATRLGTQGLLSFVVAAAAVASIVGPETEAFGVDLYVVGSTILVLGMAALSLSMLQNEILIASACCWIGTLILVMSAAFFQDAYTVVAAGTLFGAGFVLAGLELIKQLRVDVSDPTPEDAAELLKKLN